MFFSSEAIVLKRTKLSDNDMILTLFTKKAGKMNAVATGARHPKSRFAQGAHPFVLGKYNLSTGSSMAKLSSIEVHESFYHIRDDLVKLAYGAWFLELADVVTAEGVTNHKLFYDLVETVHILTSGDVSNALIKVAYELKVLDSIGVRPMLSQCINCGDSTEQKWSFSVSEGGTVCETCKNSFGSLYKVGKTLPKIMAYMLMKDMRIIVKTQIHDSYIERLDNILSAYIKYHLDRHQFKSLDFLNSVRE